MRSLAAVGLCLTLAPALAAQGPLRAPDFADVRRMIREGLVNDKATAAAVAVVRDGAIIWEEAFGWADSANGLRATPNSAFQLASLNKTIEATLAAVLEQQHRVDLDRPVNGYLRTTSVSSPVWDVGGVTLRRLLTHTAGVSTFDLGCDTGLPIGVSPPDRRRDNPGLRHHRAAARRRVRLLQHRLLHCDCGIGARGGPTGP